MLSRSRWRHETLFIELLWWRGRANLWHNERKHIHVGIGKGYLTVKNGKSRGEDSLLNQLFIHGNHVMFRCVCQIFNIIFQSEYFPNVRTTVGSQAQYAERFFIYGEYGTTALRETRKNQIMKYWARIVSNEKSTMLTNCYDVMHNHSLITENCTNWASRVRELLFSLGSVNAGFNRA